jgi:type II secretion system protein N
VTRTEVFEWVNRHRAGLITVVGYATAAMIIITVFVYLTFPWQQLSDWIRFKLERAAALEISVQESRVRFPFLLVWNGVTVRPAGRPSRVSWSADRITVGWPVGAILRRRLDFEFGLQALGGEAHGRVTVRQTPQGMKYHLEATGKGFDLAKLAAGFQLPSQDVSGAVLLTRLEHDWMNGDVLQGQGLIALEARGVEMKSLDTRFARISGSVSLKGGMGQLENISAQGDALDLVGGGSLLLRPDFMESLLNFSSRITLRKPTGPLALLSAMASSDGHVDFALRGVLRNPTPYLNGTPLGSIGASGFNFPDPTGRAGVRPANAAPRAGAPPRSSVMPGVPKP